MTDPKWNSEFYFARILNVAQGEAKENIEGWWETKFIVSFRPSHYQLKKPKTNYKNISAWHWLAHKFARISTWGPPGISSSNCFFGKLVSYMISLAPLGQ